MSDPILEPAFADATTTTRNLAYDSTLYLAGNLIAKAIGFVMIPFYARYLSTDQYGTLNLIELATTLVAIGFGIQSFGQSLVRVYHDHAGDGPEARSSRDHTVSTTLFSTILLAGFVALLAIAFAEPIAASISLLGQADVLRLAFAAMFFSAVVEIVLVYERMRNRTYFYLAYSMGTLVASLSLNILLIGWARLGVEGFVIAKLIVTFCGCMILAPRTLRAVGAAWRTSLAWALVRFGFPLVLSAAANFGIHFSDRLFLAHVSRAEVGVYALAYNFAFLLSTLVGDSFNKSWGVSFYSYASGAGWQERFAQVGRWLVFVLGAGAIGISLFGRDVLILMVPASYQPPMLLLPLLVFGYFLREVGDFFNSMLLIGAGSGLVGRIAVAGALVNLALNAWLIPRFGIWGAAWATFGTWTAYCAACWFSAWRAHRVAMHPWPLAFILLLSAGCLAARAVTAPAGPVTALALDSAAFAVFLAVTVLFYLKSAERAEAVGLVNRALAGLRKVAGT
jgi:O-antigen/teichoic acid export membrane protein